MIKTIGAFFIILSAGFLGLLKSSKLKMRFENLNKLYESMFLLEQEVSYGKKSIAFILNQTGRAKNLPIFCEMSQEIFKSSPKDAFVSLIKKSRLYLLGADNQILSDFFEHLGSTDTASQLKSISHTKNLLESAKNDAFERYKKFGKMYGEIGFLCGILATVLLF